MNKRLDYLKEKLGYNNISGMIVTNPLSIYYLIGIKQEGVLILSKYQNTFLTKYRFIDEIKQRITLDTDIIIEAFEKCVNYDFFDYGDVIGIEEDNISYLQFENIKKKFNVELVKTNSIVEKMREVKELEEIQKQEDLANILNDSFEEIKKHIVIGTKEKKLAYKISNLLKVKDIEIIDLRVSFGLNTSKEYLKPTNNELLENDICIIQVVAKKNEYVVKVGRTFIIYDKDKYSSVAELAKNNEKIQVILEKYSKLEAVYDEILKITKNHANISEVYNEIESRLEKINWNISYNLGSGIGLEAEEFPTISKSNFNIFRENMVIDISPQVYFEDNFGILIQDTVKLTRNNAIAITRINRDLEI